MRQPTKTYENVILVKSTEKAHLLKMGDESEHWFPKSQSIISMQQEGQRGELTLPSWLADKNLTIDADSETTE